MHAYYKIAVLMFALAFASAVPAAGSGDNAPSDASISASASGATGSGGSASGGTSTSGGASASGGGGSTKRTGGGMYGTYRSAPALDPARKINEQDCTKPIVHDAGNLRCI